MHRMTAVRDRAFARARRGDARARGRRNAAQGARCAARAGRGAADRGRTDAHGKADTGRRRAAFRDAGHRACGRRGACAAGVAQSSSPPPRGVGSDSTRLWGYGELNYNHPTGDAGKSQADLRRAVLGFSHAFNEDTHVYGELEWEHAVTSADDQGESEVEQLYVEHQLNPELAFRAGLTLIPLGFLNEHHEPTNYYGVERNFVETAIIPSTWREGGLSLLGSTESGFSWNVGVTTSQNLRNWDPADPEGRVSPLGAIHQELQLAERTRRRGLRRRELAGRAGPDARRRRLLRQDRAGRRRQFPGRPIRARRSAKCTRAGSRVRSIFRRCTRAARSAIPISSTSRSSAIRIRCRNRSGAATCRARGASGTMAQSSLAPFVRYEAFNTAASFESVPLGLGVPDADTERVWTVGVNYYLTPEVVFKADYQHFNITDELLGYGTRFDLGVGYQF